MRRLVLPVLASLALAAPAAAATVRGFRSPSGNIRCLVVPAPARPLTVLCELGHADDAQALEERCLGPNDQGVDWHGFSLTAAGRSKILCTGGILYVGRPRTPTLPYGHEVRHGPFRCLSARTGVTCRSRAGHGISLARESRRIW